MTLLLSGVNRSPARSVRRLLGFDIGQEFSRN